MDVFSDPQLRASVAFAATQDGLTAAGFTVNRLNTYNTVGGARHCHLQLQLQMCGLTHRRRRALAPIVPA